VDGEGKGHRAKKRWSKDQVKTKKIKYQNNKGVERDRRGEVKGYEVYGPCIGQYCESNHLRLAKTKVSMVKQAGAENDSR